MTAPKRLNAIHLKQVHQTLPSLRKEADEAFDLWASIPLNILRQLFSEDFSWSVLYELPIKQHLPIIFTLFGLTDALGEKVKATGDINQAMLDVSREVTEDEDYFEKASGRFEPNSIDDLRAMKIGPHGATLEDIAVLTYSMHYQLVALQKHGKYMSDLVEDVRNGKDESFFKAIHIDRTVLTCPTFAKRLALATIENNSEFYRLLGNALKSKWDKPLNYLNDLRVLLQACHEDGGLKDMSMNEASKLFIDELKAYYDNGEDPQRSLYRFINRWKNNK